MDNLSIFTSNFQGGARAYLFSVSFAGEDGLITGKLGESMIPKFYVKSTTLPGEDIGEVTSNYLGVDIKYATSVRYKEWSVSFNSDRKYNLHQNFTAWMHTGNTYINTISDGIKYGDPSSDGFEKDISFNLLSYSGESIKKVTLYQAWPKSVSDVSLDYSSQDIATFDVSFSYAWHKFETV